MWMLPVEKRNGLLVSLIEISHELKEKHSCFGRKPEPELIGHLSLLSVESHLLAILYERLPLPPPALTKACTLSPETQIIQLRFNQLEKKYIYMKNTVFTTHSFRNLIFVLWLLITVSHLPFIPSKIHISSWLTISPHLHAAGPLLQMDLH